MRAQLVRRRAALVTLLALVGCGAEEGASSRTPTAPVTVVSSIADGDDLVGPVDWNATVTLAGVVQVRRVEFRIDDEVRWTETSAAPYTFSTDGVLSPWVLGPGEHELTVRVVPNPGSPVEAVSHVTVPESPSGSRALAGSYTREVVAGDVVRVSEYRTEALGAIGGPAALGTWGLRIGADGILTFIHPGGVPEAETYTAVGQSMTVYGIAKWLQADQQDAFEFCHPEKDARYTWELRGKELIVLPVDRTCADRDQVLVGTWTRTG